MMKQLFLYIAIFLFFVACEKEDTPLVLPDAGPVTKVVADIGSDYSKAVFISLKNNTQVTRNWKDWDLAFESSVNGSYIWLNTGKFMFAAHTGTNDFAMADSTGKEWKIDNDALLSDSNAIGRWWNNNEVIVIDRGKVFYSGINASQRFMKVRFEQTSPTQYTFSYCNYGSSQPVTYILNKNNANALMYFSFDNGGQEIEMAPVSENWDFVLTRYTHIYYEEPLNSQFRYYLVNGGLSNKWNGISGTSMVKDSTAGYIPFEEVTASAASQLSYSTDANTIGFEWKVVDINTSTYTIVPDRYYILKDKEGFYYKIRFIDFYDDAGNRGVITMEFQRL